MNGSVDRCQNATSTMSCALRLRCSSPLVSNDYLRQSEGLKQRQVPKNVLTCETPLLVNVSTWIWNA